MNSSAWTLPSFDSDKLRVGSETYPPSHVVELKMMTRQPLPFRDILKLIADIYNIVVNAFGIRNVGIIA